jgi:CRP-like cAMP-binding protein
MATHEFKTVSFSPGEVLIKQGERADAAWLIQEGVVEVYSVTGAGAKRLASLTARNVVGEMALIDHGPRTATCVAKTPVTATEIPRVIFDKMLNSCEPMARHVLSHLVNAVRTSLGVAVVEAAVSGPDIRSTVDSSRILERRSFSPGTTIFREGDPGEAAYLIQSGSVLIMRGETTIATLAAGRTFGEMALLKNGKRMASAVVNETGATVEIIRRAEFDRLMSSMPKILQSLAHAYLSYLAERKPPPPPTAPPAPPAAG